MADAVIGAESIEKLLAAKDEPGLEAAGDVVDAGVGETVLILDEGTSARQILGLDWGAIRAVVVGVIDELIIDGELREAS